MNRYDVEKLAKELMSNHGLSEWMFKFDDGRIRFAYCDHLKRIISVSVVLAELNTYEQIRDTILHEIAHALVGWKAGHDYQWKKMAVSIGCTGDRCYKKAEVTLPSAPFETYCQNCGNTRPRYRRSRSTRACRKCCEKYNNGRFSNKYLLICRRVVTRGVGGQTNV